MSELKSVKLKKEHHELILKADYLMKEGNGTTEEIEAVLKQADEIKPKIKQAEYVEAELDKGEFIPVGQHVTPNGVSVKSMPSQKQMSEDVEESQTIQDYLNSPQYKQAWEKYSRWGETLNRKSPKLFDRLNTKTLNTIIGDQGGFLVPGDFSNLLVEERAAITMLLNYVTTVTTSSNPYKATRVEGSTGAEQDIYPNGVRAYPVNEVKTEHEAESEPRFGTLDIMVHDYALQTLLSRNLIDDSEFNLGAWLPRAFGVAQGLRTERDIIVGTGVGQLLGILNDPAFIGDASLSITGATANALTDTDFINVKYSLPNQYRRSPGVGWTMNSQTVRDVRLLKDGQGNFLWQVNYQLGQPETLCGFPILESEFMPDVVPTGTVSYPVIFGDWSQYHVPERKNLQIQVLRERWADQFKVGYQGHYRIGGQVVQPRAFRALKITT